MKLSILFIDPQGYPAVIQIPITLPHLSVFSWFLKGFSNIIFSLFFFPCFWTASLLCPLQVSSSLLLLRRARRVNLQVDGSGCFSSMKNNLLPPKKFLDCKKSNKNWSLYIFQRYCSQWRCWLCLIAGQLAV